MAKEGEENFGSLLEEEMLSEPTQRASWTSRTFSRMGQGSIRGSVFTLASTAMGIGFLGIPHVLEMTGVILGLLLIVVAGLIMYMSLRTIAKAALKYNTFHYPTITRKMMGTTMGVLLELAIILNGLGIMVGFQICSKG
jgi:amino acid permease